MASCLFASPTSRLSSAQRGAECRLPVFHTETQRNYQGNSLGVTLQRSFHCACRLSRCRCVGFIFSPWSLTGVRTWGYPDLPPSYNVKSIEHLPVRTATRSPLTVWKINTSYAIAALMIGQTKLVIPLISCSNKFQYGILHHYSIAKLVIASWLSPFITRLLTVFSLPRSDCFNNHQIGYVKLK